MGFILPFALGLLALAIPIVILYLLKVKREDLTVSSNFLWRRVLEDKQANAPWQKLQKNWLLFLQLLLLLLLVFILSRPFFTTEAQASGNIIVLLDGSATMQANDVEPSRFAKGKDEIRSIIDGMGGGDQMTLVLMRSFPEVLATNSNNKSELLAALDKAKVTSEPANPKPSIVLAAAAADRNPGTTVVVVSSGAFAREEGLPALRAKVKYIKVGNADTNIAINALQLRETGVGPQLFVGLNNYSAQSGKVTLTVTIDNKQFDTREIEVAPEDKASVTLTDLPPTTKVVDAKIKPSGSAKDYLVVDNEAWTVRNAGNPQKVLLVTPGNTFLELFLSKLPNYKVSKTTPDSYESLQNKEGYDLYIFDTYMPDKIPSGSLFLIDPPTSQFLPVTGSINLPSFARLDQNDPLLRYTDLSSVYVRQARQYQLPGWMKAVASSSEGTPMLASGDQQGQRVVLLTFDTHDSDIGLTTAWPILLVNTLSWLQPAGALDQVTEINPGEPVSFNVSERAGQTEEISVNPPGGGAQILKPTSGVASYTDTGSTGIYSVIRKITAGGKTTNAQENFVVNLYSPIASNIKPLDDLGLQGTISTENGTNARSEREFWQPLALLALVLLMVEWWIFYRPGSGRRKNSAPPASSKVKEVIKEAKS
ncbi:MAG TPA: BatA and WFA domain-containing protein [Chloroflexia bacterium]|nr:BatA and WFA domain-containing protein [Chloroflexia bacterium]